jgi:hypothetical protein
MVAPHHMDLPAMSALITNKRDAGGRTMTDFSEESLKNAVGEQRRRDYS